MQMPVPVSLLVRDHALAWTCGQCPLDRQGQVIAPGDLAAQTEAVCDYILEVLSRGDLAPEAIALLLAYYVDDGPATRAEMMAILIRRFGARPLILPVPVPHFYYAGMTLEIDVFATAAAGARRSHASEGLEIETIDGGELIWAKVSLAHAGAVADLGAALSAMGHAPDGLLRDHWFQADGESELLDSLTDAGLLTDPGAVVRRPAGDPKELLGELTFCRDPATKRRAQSGAVELRSRRSGEFLWAVARTTDEQADLVGQTKQIMPVMERALAAEGMGFADVLKLTTHYVGDDSSEALHGNMAVRNGYYASPGPASTGLPVHGLGDPRSLITIDLTARRRA